MVWIREIKLQMVSTDFTHTHTHTINGWWDKTLPVFKSPYNVTTYNFRKCTFIIKTISHNFIISSSTHHTHTHHAEIYWQLPLKGWYRCKLFNSLPNNVNILFYFSVPKEQIFNQNYLLFSANWNSERNLPAEDFNSMHAPLGVKLVTDTKGTIE